MDKITKLIRSALNNSSANEASQALKVAASLMQAGGFNPSEFLRASEDAAGRDDIHSLMSRIAELESENKDLSNELNNVYSNTTHTSQEELREAKEVAIKWHRRAMTLEEENTDYARSSVKSANEADHFEKKFKKKTDQLLYVSVIAAVEFFIIMAMR